MSVAWREAAGNKSKTPYDLPTVNRHFYQTTTELPGWRGLKRTVTRAPG